MRLTTLVSATACVLQITSIAMTILRAFRPRLLFPAERQLVLQAERHFPSLPSLGAATLELFFISPSVTPLPMVATAIVVKARTICRSLDRKGRADERNMDRTTLCYQVAG